MDNIMEYARQFCPPNKAAKAVGRIKRAVQTGWEIPMESALAVERENQQLLFQSEDAKEGLAAYVEKRPAECKAKEITTTKDTKVTKERHRGRKPIKARVFSPLCLPL